MRKPTLAQIYAKVPDAGCKGLCSESCGPIPLTASERHLVARTPHYLDGEPAILFDERRNCCPFLNESKRCSIYDERPLICRLFGVAESMPCGFGCVGSQITDKYAGKLLKMAGAL